MTQATTLFKAMANALRLSMLLELRSGPRCVHQLVEAVGASQSLVSQHLGVLRGAGLVSTERRGKEIAYSLADDHVTHIVLDAIEHSQEGGSP
ncbi:N/A [soil metagenome]